MLRMETTLPQDASAVWTPTGETLLQVEVLSDIPPVLIIETRVHADAPLQQIHAVRLDPANRVIRIAQLPYLKVKIRDNTNGKRVTVWDNK